MEKIILKIKDSFIIIAFITSMIIWYANTNSRLNAVEAKVVEQQSIASQISQLNIDMAVVKANVAFIKERVR